ncbi:MAG: hybrid sensor histidine kinase/response regulator [Candidatus Binatia bacterium]
MTRRARVLVVDDELGVRESLRAILGAEYEVLTASTGEEALEILDRERVDVITLDLRMPGIPGLTVLERAKRIDADVEVLVITGYGSFDTALEGLRHRAFDYLTKPFETDRVRALVEKAVASRATARLLKAAPENMLAGLSHEFRTPLNVIMGYSTMLREEACGSLSEDQRQALDRIQSNSSTLLSYMETLFYLAELDRGMVPVATSEVRVSTLLGRVRDELGARAREKGLTLTVEAEADLVFTTDEDKLLRLLRVLADNAVRYTQIGHVVLAARPIAGGVVLEVHDTGPGLPRDVLGETRAALAGSPPGDGNVRLGFGLRLAQRLVHLLGAALSIDTGPEGTTFRIALADLADSRTQPLASNG